MLAFTFDGGFESYLRSHSFNHLQFLKIKLRRISPHLNCLVEDFQVLSRIQLGVVEACGTNALPIGVVIICDSQDLTLHTMLSDGVETVRQT